MPRGCCCRGVQWGGSLRSRGPEHPVPWGVPQPMNPFGVGVPMPAWLQRCQGAVPHGAPGRARLAAAPEMGARSFPSAFLPEDGCLWGPHGVAPGSLGTGGTAGQGWRWPGCMEPRRDGQGDHTVARPEAAEGECLGGGVFSAEVASPQPSPLQCSWPASKLGGWAPPSLGQGAEEDVSEKWRWPVFMRVEWPGVPRRGRGRGPPRSQGTARLSRDCQTHCCAFWARRGAPR